MSLNEVPGKGHWFDGVVDDEILQPFIEKHLASAMKPRLPSQFTMVTLNPASTGSRGGMRILSLEVVFQLSRLRIRRETPEPGSWTIASENVRRFRYEPVPGIIDRPIRLYIDGSKSPLLLDPSSLAASKSFVDYCSESSSELASTDSRGIAWYECADTKSWGTETSLERGPDNSGPAFQVLGQRKVVIVFPEEDHELQSSAVSYANSLYLRGISVQVTGDSEYETSAPEILGRANVILLGGPDVNRASKRFATDGFTADVEFGKDRICVGAVKCFAKPGIGVAFLSNGPKRTLLFYTAGTDRDGLMSVLSYLPHSPESNVPEWVVVSREKGWGFRGLGGVIGLGYFDRRWKFEPRKSYPAEFIFDVKQSGVTCATRRAKHFALTWSGGIIALFVGILVLVLGMSVVVVRRRREARASRYEEVQSDETAASLGPAIEKSMKHEERCLMEEEHVS